jgi:hypothetical protein
VRPRPVTLQHDSVSQDWRVPLKGDKSQVYFHCAQRLEIAYSMFSVNLDEAFGLRRHGRSSKACQLLSVAPDLCQRLAYPLRSLLRTMAEHAKHFGITPNIAPLDVKNFQHARSRRVALYNDVFSRVLLTRKSQFSYKISAIADLVDELDASFIAAAEELSAGDSTSPDRKWELLDAAHYDLNTCLRETVVLFKSFLHALPDQLIPSFQAALHECQANSPSLAARARHLAHRRMAFLKGQ